MVEVELLRGKIGYEVVTNTPEGKNKTIKYHLVGDKFDIPEEDIPSYGANRLKIVGKEAEKDVEVVPISEPEEQEKKDEAEVVPIISKGKPKKRGKRKR
jgi:hypothetical protein